jgi:hypothetical protein
VSAALSELKAAVMDFCPVTQLDIVLRMTSAALLPSAFALAPNGQKSPLAQPQPVFALLIMLW